MSYDGSIRIGAEIDDKQAQKELNRLENSIKRAQDSLDKASSNRNQIAEKLRDAQKEAIEAYNEVERLQRKLAGSQAKTSPSYKGGINADEFAAELENQKQISAQLKEQELILAEKEKAAIRLEQQDAKAVQRIDEQTAALERQRSEYDQINLQLQQQGVQAWPQVKAAAANAMSGVSGSLRQGLKTMLKYGLGIRSMYILFRRLRSALIDGIKQFANYDAETRNSINNLKGALSGLKGSFVSAFAPIVNAVVPYLVTLINWIAKAADAVAQFFALLGGKSTYKRAVSGLNAVGGAASGAGAAAKEALKQFSGLDELNIWQEDKGSGGGGGGGSGSGGGLSWEEVPVESDTFASKLAVSFNDILFDWDDLTGEQIAEKAIAALLGIMAGVAGFLLTGSLKGGLVGTILGVTLGAVTSTMIFDHDGEISKDEILRMIADAATTLAGGVIGFLATGGTIKGALVGASIGATIFPLISAVFGESGVLTADQARGVIAGSLATILGGIAAFRVGGTAIIGSLLAAAAVATLAVSLPIVVDIVTGKGYTDQLQETVDGVVQHLKDSFMNEKPDDENWFEWLLEKLQQDIDQVMSDLAEWWNGTAWGQRMNQINEADGFVETLKAMFGPLPVADDTWLGPGTNKRLPAGTYDRENQTYTLEADNIVLDLTDPNVWEEWDLSSLPVYYGDNYEWMKHAHAPSTGDQSATWLDTLVETAKTKLAEHRFDITANVTMINDVVAEKDKVLNKFEGKVSKATKGDDYKPSALDVTGSVTSAGPAPSMRGKAMATLDVHGGVISASQARSYSPTSVKTIASLYTSTLANGWVKPSVNTKAQLYMTTFSDKWKTPSAYTKALLGETGFYKTWKTPNAYTKALLGESGFYKTWKTPNAYAKALLGEYGFYSSWETPSAYTQALLNSYDFSSSWQVPQMYATAVISGIQWASGVINSIQTAINNMFRAEGGTYFGGAWHSIPQYAGGTARAHGSLFLAGEAGAEVVGHVGGRTEVLNRSQLASVMYHAIINGMASSLAGLRSVISNIGVVVGRVGGSVDRLVDLVSAQNVAIAGPAMAAGTVVPPQVLACTTDISSIRSALDRLTASLDNGGRSADYRFTAEINRRVLFDEILDEGRLRQAQTGNNPFNF